MVQQNQNGNGRGDSSAFDDWDAVFADPDPTRVLSPSAEGQDASGAGSSVASGGADGVGISATRYRAETQPMVAQPVADSVAVQAEYRPAVEYAPVAGARREGLGEEATSQQVDGSGSSVSAYRRIQFIPSIIGVLAGYTAAKGLVYLGQVLAEMLGLRVYGSPTAAVLELFDAGTSGRALPWVIILAVAYFCAFMLAGYAAARMSAIAPAKQALGVALVTLLGLLLTSLLTWVSSMTGGSLTPTFSLNFFLADSIPTGLLTLFGFFVLILVGALAGAGFGSRYHKKLARSRA